MEADLYTVLGLSNNAGKDEIRKAYKKLAFRYHPDQNPNNPFAEEQFKLINRAYHILSNDTLKSKYDQGVENPTTISSVHDLYEYYKKRRERYQENFVFEEEKNTIPEKLKKRIFIITGGAILVLVVFGIFFYYFMNRYTAIQALAEAENYIQQRNFMEAYKYIKFADSKYPGYAESYVVKAKWLKAKNDNHLKVLKSIQMAFDLTEEPTELMFEIRGDCFYELNQFDKALQDFETMINLNPKNGKAWFLRAKTLLKKDTKAGQESCMNFLKAAELGYEEGKHYHLIYCR